MSMLKKLGKQYAREIAQKVEEVTLQALNEHNPQNVTTEETTEKLHTITGKRKALYIGINYVGQKNALRWVFEIKYFGHESFFRWTRMNGTLRNPIVDKSNS